MVRSIALFGIFIFFSQFSSADERRVYEPLYGNPTPSQRQALTEALEAHGMSSVQFVDGSVSYSVPETIYFGPTSNLVSTFTNQTECLANRDKYMKYVSLVSQTFIWADCLESDCGMRSTR